MTSNQGSRRYDDSSFAEEELRLTGRSLIASGVRSSAIEPLPSIAQFADLETFRLRHFPDSSPSSFLDVSISNEFSDVQRTLLKQALLEYAALCRWELYMPYLEGRLDEPLIEARDNALTFPTNNARHDTFLPALDEPHKIHICYALSWGNQHGAPQTLKITAFAEEPDANGSWKAGLAQVNFFDTALRLEISLNKSYVNSAREGYRGQSYRLWAGVIGHEIMHNLGWQHTQEPTEKTFIVAMTRFFSSATARARFDDKIVM